MVIALTCPPNIHVSTSFLNIGVLFCFILDSKQWPSFGNDWNIPSLVDQDKEVEAIEEDLSDSDREDDNTL